ncbi:hypothetical protein CEXT_654771 [Caerostris extrusa]|uniref:Uncharacterized protein n=1 Tax=Caerostris extrusa TaxID=172846 RepID=A0AAV4VAJ6_CAEEX|nr:hypothetical protein CEXT_654771 [Caerostris extrusa]
MLLHINAIFLFTMERRGSRIRLERRTEEKNKRPLFSQSLREKGGSKFRDFVRKSECSAVAVQRNFLERPTNSLSGRLETFTVENVRELPLNLDGNFTFCRTCNSQYGGFCEDFRNSSTTMFHTYIKVPFSIF